MEAPRIPSIFKANQPKEFRYRPFFYNAEKEERENRNRLIRSESDSNKAGNSEFKSRLRERWEMSNHASKKANSSNLRLIVIFIILLGIAYFILK